MNHVKEAQAAFAQAVATAASKGVPFEIWPRDQHRLTLENIPVLRDATQYEGRLTRVIYARTDAELQVELKSSFSYGVIDAQRTHDGALIVGEYERA